MGFFSSGFGRILAGVGTMGMSEALRIPGIGQIAGSGVGTALGGPIGGAIGGALGSSAQSMLGFGGSSPSQDAIQLATAQNMFNSAMTKQQMDFQERMSSTAHQREVADLRAAGLNPVLSANHGGASTPAGASIPAVDVTATVANSALRQQEISNQFLKIMSEVAVNATQATKNMTEVQSTEQDVLKKRFENIGTKEILEMTDSKFVNPLSDRYMGKNIVETDTAKRLLLNYEVEGRLKESQLQLNNALKELSHLQGLTEKQKALLTGTNYAQAYEALKEAYNQGKVSESKFAAALAYFDRFTDSIKPYLGIIPGSSSGNARRDVYHHRVD